MSHQALAKTAPMGWNSWDCFGAAVNEKELRENADYMAKNLKDYGWEYVPQKRFSCFSGTSFQSGNKAVRRKIWKINYINMSFTAIRAVFHAAAE
jgi:hypothetical protein